MSCTSSVLNPESAAHAMSVPSDFNTYPLVPNAKAEGLPLASPIITLPRARPAILASVT